MTEINIRNNDIYVNEVKRAKAFYWFLGDRRDVKEPRMGRVEVTYGWFTMVYDLAHIEAWIDGENDSDDYGHYTVQMDIEDALDVVSDLSLMHEICHKTEDALDRIIASNEKIAEALKEAR